MNRCFSLIEAILVKSEAVIISQTSLVQKAGTTLREDKSLFLTEIAPTNF